MSDLLHGDDVGFVINAYLALQHQWPDSGGFHHFLYELQQRPHSRPAVLNTLARSESAQLTGSEPVIDVAADLLFDPAKQDPALYTAISQRLRLWRVIADTEQNRQSLRSIASDQIGTALGLAIESSQASMTMVESRVEALTQELAALRSTLGAVTERLAEPVLSPGAETMAELRRGLLQLAARVSALEQRPAATGANVDLAPIKTELSEIKAAIAAQGQVLHPLHSFVSYDLKRLVAEYVNAFVRVQLDLHALQPTPPAVSPPTPTAAASHD